MHFIAPHVYDFDKVLTLRQPRQIYLLPSLPQDDHKCLDGRNILVWKDEQNQWHFKMRLLDKLYQGLFDSTTLDQSVIAGLNALATHPDLSKQEVSEQLGPDLRGLIARACLRLISDALIDENTNKDALIDENTNKKKNSWQLHVWRFRVLLVVEAVEDALLCLEASVPLSDEDRVLVTQSLSVLRKANTILVDSNLEREDLLTFKRTTDKVLQAAHIQRLYTHPRFPWLGMFSDRVASSEFEALKLSLIELCDISEIRVFANDQTLLILNVIFVGVTLLAAGYVLCVGGEVSAGVAVLAILGLAIGLAILATMTLGMILAVGYGVSLAFGAVTQALGSFFNHDDLNRHEPAHDEVEEIPLASV
ncbi:MAG: hypothetical protein GW760_03125 [Legionella sp.]|nr:hypothetical protein [Legionella sp.]